MSETSLANSNQWLQQQNPLYMTPGMQPVNQVPNIQPPYAPGMQPDSSVIPGAKPPQSTYTPQDPTGMENFAMGAQGISSLAGAWQAYQNQGLMEDQLAFQQEAYDTNLANQAATTNLSLANQYIMAQQMGGAGYDESVEAAPTEAVQVRGTR